MKKTLKITLAILTVMLVVISMTAIAVCANTGDPAAEPELSIKACTLAFDDAVYIMYAVPEEAAAGADVKILYFTEPMATIEEYNKDNAVYCESSFGRDTVEGVECITFKNKHLNAKNMTDVIYSRAYAKVGDKEYYSPLVKYSILEYAYNMLGYTTNNEPTPKLEKMLKNMLSYGASAQEYFNYNLENLATDEYFKISVVGGVMADACTKGLYKDEAELTITAPLTNSEGASFAGWRDSTGAKVSTDAEYIVTVNGKNETYTAEYVKYSVGLEFDEDVKGAYVVDMGDCTDTEVVIPAVSPEGNAVVGIDGAFASTDIISISIPNTVIRIESNSFKNCNALERVYYDGSSLQWNEIDIATRGNDALINAEKIFAVKTYTVTFVDYDGSEIEKVENVSYGASVTAPEAPTRDGYNFVGWDVDFSNVTSDLTVTAQYEEKSTEPTFVVDSVEASAGDTVEVRVRVENNPGIASIALDVYYSEVLTLTDYAFGTIGGLPVGPQTGKFDEKPAKLRWTLGTENKYGDFIFATLTFKVSDTAVAGDYEITITYDPDDIYNIANENINFKIEDGKISL